MGIPRGVWASLELANGVAAVVLNSSSCLAKTSLVDFIKQVAWSSLA